MGRVVKRYKRPHDGTWKEGRGNSLINTCIECDEALVSNDDYDYASEWWASYTCTSCGRTYRYMPSDMGQTMPTLEQYKGGRVDDE